VANQSTTSEARVVSFGPFRLLPAQQLLLEGETPVRLGSRALEILTALALRAGELVSKDELMTRVWPDTVVEEGNLKVHVAALRKTLGDGRPGRRYLATVPGRGYRFVAPVELSEPEGPLSYEAATSERTHNLPASPPRAIGRAETISTLLDQLPQRRFVTIVGPGGIGKTTVALAVAEALIAAYEDGVRFVDLAPLGDPQFVPAALASALGIAIHSENAVSALIDALQHKRMLLVLDNCEHVIDIAATLAEQIFDCALGVHILATSREALRAKGERVHLLSPLASPPSSPKLTAAEALTYPAVQLFVECAAANVDGFELSDADAPVVADICRKLDGIALAIELTATRIEAFGVRQLAALLADRFPLLRHGRRTALPRHRTLAAALDWSYEFLPENERIVLRRLSVFAGNFTIEAANAVVAGAPVDGAEVIDILANLVGKSLVSADVSGATVHYRLLDTTRAYTRQKLAESSELDDFVRRHAEYHRDILQRAEAESAARPTTEWLSDYGRSIDDVRAGLNWAFSPSGDISIGAALTVAAIPLWMHLSLMDECRACVERLLASQVAAPRRSERDEMKLYAALATARPHVRGPLPETEAAWTNALRIAESLDDREYQLRTIWGLFVCRIYVGDYRGALGLAERFRTVATKKGDPAAGLIGDRLAGTALHYLGDQPSAQQHICRMLNQYVAPVHGSHIVRFQFDQRALAWGTLSYVIWLQGFPDQAVRMARNSLDDARTSDHALSLCYALGFAACPIALYVGDLAQAERYVTILLEHSAKHALAVWNTLGRCLKGWLLLEQGDTTGLQLLRTDLNMLREHRFGFRYTEFLGTLARGLGAAGQIVVAHTAIDEALDRSERGEERWCMAELLRIKGELLRLDGSAGAVSAAEDHYRQSLEWARRQDALSWELRTATSLARMWLQHGRTREANELLSPVYGRFSEGFETKDLNTARALIDSFPNSRFSSDIG
jgi:predicted ATPase/DNA-binding winged helix-turn-helix (wHTH) protein